MLWRISSKILVEMSKVIGNLGFGLSEFWYVYGADPKRWAARFDLEPFMSPCNDCGLPVETTLPFVVGPFRGLAANCSCGSRVPYCLVRANGKDLFDESCL